MHVWRGLAVQDAKPTDIRSAVGLLMRASRFSTERLAMCLGVLPNTVKNIMVTGKAKPEVLKSLARVSREFNMPLLAEFFDHQAGKLLMNKGRKMADRWGGTSGV